MITLVAGRPGAGKSSLVAALTRDAPRVVYADPLAVPPGITHVVDAYPADAGAIPWSSGTWRVLWRAEPAWRLWRAIRDYALVLEEAGALWPTGVIYDAEARMLLTRARHYRQHVYVVTQRPALIPPLVRALAREVYALALTLPEDSRYIRDWIGVEPPTARYRYRAWRAEAKSG